MSTLIANEQDLRDVRRAREALLLPAGALDAKRPRAWEAYGYPEQLTFEHFMAAYDRGGPAHRAVHMLLSGCWAKLPRIREPGAETPTKWEQDAAVVLTGCQAWAKLRDVDRRNMVGRYAGAIMRISDGKALDQPLVRGTGLRLVDLVPVFESQLEVVEWHQDPADPDNYGKPRMWQYRARRPDATDTQGQPESWERVHPSRVLVLAEGSVGDPFDGVPLLRAGFNALVDLEKIAGGSAESYLKNSSRTLVFKYDKDISLDGAVGPDGKPVDMRQLHQQRTQDLNRNIDSAAVVKGGDVTTLQTSVADPSKPFEVAGYLFAASVGLSFSGLFGQRLGQLAGEQDRAADRERFEERRVNTLTPLLVELITRLQALGIVGEGAFEVAWPDLAAPSKLDMLGIAAKMAEVNRTAPGAGGEPAFDADEIRQAAGYKARDALPVGEGGDGA